MNGQASWTETVDALRRALREAGDPERARGQQAYMKSTLPYYGVRVPEVRRLATATFAKMPLENESAWHACARDLWNSATHREERYAVLALLGDRRAKRWQTRSAVPLYEELIVDAAWWDLVDEIAGKRLLDVLRNESAWMPTALRKWAHGSDIWLRRSAIISQLRAKTQTDHELLADCIEPSLDSQEFFLRKGIGWALREYSKSNPEWVRGYVERHRMRLSPLSFKEATRRLPALR